MAVTYDQKTKVILSKVLNASREPRVLSPCSIGLYYGSARNVHSEFLTCHTVVHGQHMRRKFYWNDVLKTWEQTLRTMKPGLWKQRSVVFLGTPGAKNMCHLLSKGWWKQGWGLLSLESRQIWWNIWRETGPLFKERGQSFNTSLYRWLTIKYNKNMVQ